MTSSNAASTVKRHPARRPARSTLRWARHPSRSKMARGSGDHQVSTGSDDQGKMPALYAVTRVSKSRRPPSATRPFGSDPSAGSASSTGVGLDRSLASTPVSLSAPRGASPLGAVTGRGVRALGPAGHRSGPARLALALALDGWVGRRPFARAPAAPADHPPLAYSLPGLPGADFVRRDRKNTPLD